MSFSPGRAGCCGPVELWRRFDGAVADLNRAATGTDLLEVADAYQALAEIAGELATAVDREDREGVRAPRRRARTAG
jgi:hypothetical protein